MIRHRPIPSIRVVVRTTVLLLAATLASLSPFEATRVYAEFVVCSAAGTNEDKEACYKYFSDNNVLYYDPYATDNCTDETGANLTLDQKIGQLLILGFDSTDDGVLEVMKKYNTGGAYFNGSGLRPIDPEKIKILNASLPTDSMLGSDDEGGNVHRFLTGKPSAQEMGSTTSSAVETVGAQVGTELKAKGISMLLAPVLDIDGPNKNNATSGASKRSFGSDPEAIAEKAGAFASGVASAGVGVTFKHFPGLRITEKNTDNTYQEYIATTADLQQDILPYRKLKDMDKASVMLSNLVVSAWGSAPISTNAQAIEYLRSDVGFRGMITTDDLNVLANYGSHAIPLETSVVNALNAGVDMPLFRYTNSQELESIISAIKSKVDQNTINMAYAHAIAYKSAIGLSTTRVTSSSGTSSTSGTSADERARVEQALRFLTSKGMTLAMAAGMLGNMKQESGVNPRILQGGQIAPEDAAPTDGRGFGLVQWTDKSRQEPLVELAHTTGRKTTDMTAQLDYVIQELNGGWKSTVQALVALPNGTPTQYAIIFHGRTPKTMDDPRFTIAPKLGYEASGDDADFVVRVRGGNAENYYNEWKGEIPDGSGIGGGVMTSGNPQSNSGNNVACGGSSSAAVASETCSATAPVTGEGGNGHQLSQTELTALYGQPVPQSGMESKMVNVNFLGHNVKVHPAVAGCLQAVANEIKTNNIQYEIKVMGGYRLDGTGTGQIGLRSYHSYGVAVDINPATNPYTTGTAPHDIPQSYVDAFHHHGWSWGGGWNSVKDYMHFEYNGPTQGLSQ
jgi:beta-N-acetylhexosaminidase